MHDGGTITDAMDTSQTERQAALAAIGLPTLQVVADPEDIDALEQRPGFRIRFAEALRLALEAFLSGRRGSSEHSHDSAQDVIRAAPEDFGLDRQPTDAAIREVLRSMLANDPQAKIVLLTPATVRIDDYRFLPEQGEPIDDRWVFRIIAPSNWPFLQWSIVDPAGQAPAYSYEFD